LGVAGCTSAMADEGEGGNDVHFGGFGSSQYGNAETN
jgi:hypothetical protein